MKLSSVINKKLMFLDLAATTAEGVIAEMLEQVVDVLDLDRGYMQGFIEGVVARERQAVTAFGKEVAFPHARLDHFEDFAIVIGKSKKGVDCNALDKQPVKIFFMILTAKTKNAQLLQGLASLSELIQDESIRTQLLATDEPHDVYTIIENSGVEFKKSIVAEDIMIEDLITASPDMTMKEISDLLFDKNIAGVPVVDNGKLVGEITEKELIKKGLPPSMGMLSSVSFIKDFEPFEKFFKEEDTVLVKELYNRDIITVKRNTSIVEVAFLFVQKSRRRLYVVDDNKQLIGIIMRHHLLMKVLHP